MACSPLSASAFVAPNSNAFGVVTSASSATSLNMVLEAPRKEKKLSKIEVLKTNSDHLIHPLKEVSKILMHAVYCTVVVVSYDS